MKRDSLGIGCCIVGALLVANLAGPLAAQAPAPSGAVITIAGNGMGGFSGDVLSIAIDRQRNTLYLPSFSLNRVSQLDLASGGRQ